jgi:hypothetical protein
LKFLDRLMKLDGVVAKAGEAQVELKLLGEAFQKLRNDLVSAWMETNPRDDAGREKLWLATTQLTQVERTLRTVVQSGEVAQKEIAAIKSAGDPRKGLIRRRI